MPDPFRLQVLKAITDTIKTVTPANGYEHDLSQAVFRGRVIFGAGDPLPMVSILEAPLQPDSYDTPEDSRDVWGELQLLVQGFVVDDLENPTDPAHKLMFEVKKALAATKERSNILELGTKVTKLNIGQGVCRPADGQVSDKTYFWLPVSVTFVEDLTA